MMPPGLTISTRGREQLALQLGHPGDVGRRLVPADVGVAADRAGGGAGRIEQHGVLRGWRSPFARIGDHDLGLEPQPREIVSQPLGALGGDLQRRDLGATDAELRGLAAWRGAEIAHLSAGDVAQKARGQGGRRILHPPGALAVARQLLDRAAGGAAHRCSKIIIASSRSAHRSTSCRTVRSSGGSPRCAAAIALVRASP